MVDSSSFAGDISFSPEPEAAPEPEPEPAAEPAPEIDEPWLKIGKAQDNSSIISTVSLNSRVVFFDIENISSSKKVIIHTKLLPHTFSYDPVSIYNDTFC